MHHQLRTYTFSFFAALFSYTIDAIAQMPIVLTGSTPGGEAIQSILNIPGTFNIDFIRWKLTLKENKNEPQSFHLSIQAGIAKQGTREFERGHRTKEIEGTYTVHRTTTEKKRRIIYTLSSKDLPKMLSLLRLNNNLFHILENGTEMLVGNGGWAFTLNRTPSVVPSSGNSSQTIPYASVVDDTASMFVFHGRTPCREIALQLHLSPPRRVDENKMAFYILS